MGAKWQYSPRAEIVWFGCQKRGLGWSGPYLDLPLQTTVLMSVKGGLQFWQTYWYFTLVQSQILHYEALKHPFHVLSLLNSIQLWEWIWHTCIIMHFYFIVLEHCSWELKQPCFSLLPDIEYTGMSFPSSKWAIFHTHSYSAK